MGQHEFCSLKTGSIWITCRSSLVTKILKILSPVVFTLFVISMRSSPQKPHSNVLDCHPGYFEISRRLSSWGLSTCTVEWKFIQDFVSGRRLHKTRNLGPHWKLSILIEIAALELFSLWNVCSGWKCTFYSYSKIEKINVKNEVNLLRMIFFFHFLRNICNFQR